MIPHFFELAIDSSQSKTLERGGHDTLGTRLSAARWLQLVWFVLLAFGSSAMLMADDDSFDRESLMFRDEVRLKSGVVLVGKIIEQKQVDKRRVVVFESIEGGRMTIDLSRIVDEKGVRPITEIGKKYNRHLEALKDTAAEHHDLVIWCEGQDSGSAIFKDQIKFHRKRIMELDPNDDRVRRKLGYDYFESRGRWLIEKQYWNSIGYVRSGGTWIPTLRASLNQQGQGNRGNSKSSLAEFGSWQSRLKRMNKPQAEAQLVQIVDASLLPTLYEAMLKEKNPQIRAVYAEAFGRVPHPISIKALVHLYMEGASERMLDLLKQDGFNRESAAANLVGFLGHADNSVVNRAAFAIGELGAQNVILTLADALETKHTIRAAGNPGRMNVGFGNNGINNFGVGGQGQKVERMLPNREVYEALRKITEQDFGYSKASWHRWFIDHYTHRKMPARR